MLISVQKHQHLQFTDEKSKASWVKPAIDFVSSNDIMKGPNFEFEPNANHTKQQAFATILRLYENYKIK